MSLPGLNAVTDPNVRAALQFLWRRIGQTTGTDPGGTRLTGILDAHGHRIRDLANPTAAQDAVPLAYGESVWGPEVLRRALQVNGSHTLNVNGLPGVLSEAQRMGIRVWPEGNPALPDVKTGRPFEVIAWRGALYYFSPTPTPPGRWVLLTATASLNVGTHADRPDPEEQSLGTIYWESDRLAAYYVLDVAGTKVWRLLEGVGGPMQGTIGSVDTKPGDLGTDDEGFRFWATNFDREYRWNGTGWEDAPGFESTRGQIVVFDTTHLPGSLIGWQLCDGSTNVEFSLANGTTALFDVPNVNGRMIRGTTGATGTGATGGADSVNSGVTGDTVVVQSGAGTTVAASTHTHSVATLSAYMSFGVYVRL